VDSPWVLPYADVPMESQSTSNPQRHGLPKPSQQWPERERVLEAMVRVAAAKSYEATTVADVIERAEVSQESFEKMFDDKNSCFLEAYDRVVDALLADVLHAFESAAAESWPTQIVAGLRALVEWIAAEADIVLLWSASHLCSRRAVAIPAGERACPPTPPASRSAAQLR
jgi:AcrR family transcriptional regulator